MERAWKELRGWMVIAIPLALLAGCAGINDRQLMADQIVYEAHAVQKKADTKRAEFDQLVAEYRATLEECYLTRMSALIDFMEEDAKLAETFYRQQKYYHKGISYYRWEASRHAYELARKHLCEMILTTAELEMVFADRDKAGLLLKRLLASFPGEGYEGYRQAARNRMAELGLNAKIMAARAEIANEEVR